MSDADYEAVWRDFTAGGKITGEVESWHAEPENPLVHLVYLISLAGEAAVGERTATIQAGLAFPYVNPVPPTNLHVSVRGFDLPAALWAERRADLIEASRRTLAGFGPFTIYLQHANSFQMAAIVEAHDGGKVQQLRARLREHMPAWTMLDADAFVQNGQDTWLPHMSIAYYRAVGDDAVAAAALVAALEPFRSYDVGTVTVRSLQLLSVPTLSGPHRWRWPVEASFDLAG